MAYTVKEVARLSGVSVRTLHYYDEIGLLQPAYTGGNGYRYYEEEQLLKLQQIMFFREMDIPLANIAEILNSGGFDRISTLEAHKTMLEGKAKRLDALLQTIGKTIEHLKGELAMSDEELYYGFDSEKQKRYDQEVMERYGGTPEGLRMIEESRRRVKNMGKDDFARIKAASEELHRELAQALERGDSTGSGAVQSIIRKHYEWINNFYTPTKEVYAGLGDLYVDHPDFRKLYDSFHPQLAEFMRDSMKVFADRELG